MSIEKKHVAAFIVVAAVLVWGVVFSPSQERAGDTAGDSSADTAERTFSGFGLQTNTEKASIPLNEVLSGGPGKDGIPAINNPAFVSVEDAQVNDETLGVLVTIGEEKRYYPYNILVWHEIVNDQIDGTHFAVTFCPLCGSAIVFDREVGGEVLTFGVSGLLWESNLLMYDTKTESLWSQAKSEAVVGDYTGTTLTVMDMRLLEFAALKDVHPDARVLSRDTGFSRSYDFEPYSGYEETEETIFPISISDTRFPAKQIMYVTPVHGWSVAFPDAHLSGTATLTLEDGTELVAERVEDGIKVTADNVALPGYYEMWFSWAIHHQEDGVVWNVDGE